MLARPWGSPTPPPHTHTGGTSANGYNNLGNTGSFFQENVHHSHNSTISLLVTYPGEVKMELQKDLQSDVYCSLISHSSNLETTPVGK